MKTNLSSIARLVCTTSKAKLKCGQFHLTVAMNVVTHFAILKVVKSKKGLNIEEFRSVEHRALLARFSFCDLSSQNVIRHIITTIGPPPRHTIRWKDCIGAY